ncbi:UDP-N-acetylmuramoyl-tripeptide--D-alanyl-D-alanine ligase [Sporosarcina sp. BI001-red]|uniref:UDP-N-acetylmuramoyl-tripeptide--D-alanyl-D- alanine ligase n=1 Tax=Sporosarcina sp. BI001-red TaxID=2282866 RepID=UPI000E27D767|nr:UDP-N-acetylmuramoyl-tripeptide--D-alanyl-D-alanine ligase [Sporosarcina sp. BI001-red]REB07772.1 UDP-N-acetylmuramoyl-tripeptide--D-alanyl-D-alanine ligase [Sporosarcina sp. BI001-red]
MKRKLTELANWLDASGQLLEGIIVTGATIDSRNIKEGELFIPFRGEHANGHTYVRSAIENGASASLWLADEPNPPEDIPLLFVENAELALQQLARNYREQLTCKVIGVTGSNGKTSTKDLLASVLGDSFAVRKTEGNFNNELGMPLTILSLEEDTEVAVLEMGMSGFGEISFLSQLAKPDIAIITNIGEAHMQDLGSREGIAKAKFEIIDGLSSNGAFYYDGDEPLLTALVNEHPELDARAFGYGSTSDLLAKDIQVTEQGSRFTVAGQLEGQFVIPVFGEHQVKNSLAAMLVAKKLGMTEETIRRALLNAVLTPMRMQPVTAKSGALFINDAYNAAPTSLHAALTFIGQTELRRDKWIVLGDMLELGQDERHFHESVADQLANLQLKGIALYGPRMHWLYDELRNRNTTAELIWTEKDYAPIIEKLLESIDDQSIILLKGSRGMALENVLKGVLETEE